LFDGMMLFGVGLIVGGTGLLTSAIVGAQRSRSSRHRRNAWRRLDRTRSAPAPDQPSIRPSALLADTVLLKPVQPRVPKPPPAVRVPPPR
jgi:hypothetical protein